MTWLFKPDAETRRIHGRDPFEENYYARTPMLYVKTVIASLPCVGARALLPCVGARALKPCVDDADPDAISDSEGRTQHDEADTRLGTAAENTICGKKAWASVRINDKFQFDKNGPI